VIFDLSVDRAFPNFAQAQAARGEMNIEVRHRTAAAPPTPTTPPPVGAPPPLTQATTPVGGLFDTKVTLPVVGQVPLVAVLAAAVGAYFVFVD
jgi:hypothetical protein